MNIEPFRVWVFDNRSGFEGAEFSVLDEQERQHCARLRSPASQTAFVTTRSALRHILGRALGLPPEDIAFDRNAFGKLTLAGDLVAGLATDLEFSVSHAAELSTIALSDGRPIGIDVEQRRAFPDGVRLAADAFGPEAARQLAVVPRAVADAAFVQLWTAGEAFVKAHGGGFAALHRKVPVGLSAGPAPRAELSASALAVGWTLHPLSLSPEFVSRGFVGHVVMGAEVKPRRQNRPGHSFVESAMERPATAAFARG